jgi:hypothetical protein
VKKRKGGKKKMEAQRKPIVDVPLEECLAGLLKRNGMIRPDDLVSEAAEPDHPLHGRFEWDDAKAAHEARLYTARKLIASVQMEVTINEVVLEIPVYVHDPRTPEQGYQAMARIKNKSELAREVVRAEVSAAASALARAEAIAEVLGERAAVSLVRKKADKLKSRFE